LVLQIEGNHTTLADYVESKVEGTQSSTDQLKEINNIEAAMEFIDEYLSNGDEITEYFIRELHSLAVVGLQQKATERPAHIDNIMSASLSLTICRRTTSALLIIWRN
jgi:Fic family protein